MNQAKTLKRPRITKKAPLTPEEEVKVLRKEIRKAYWLLEEYGCETALVKIPRLLERQICKWERRNRHIVSAALTPEPQKEE